MIATACTIVLPISSISTGAGVFLAGQAVAFLTRRQRPQPLSSEQSVGQSEPEQQPSAPSVKHDDSPGVQSPPAITAFKFYRKLEAERVVASLKANGQILITGKEGIGKSTLCNAVVEKLKDEGFAVVHLEESATPKHLLKEIADQVGVSTQSLEGKMISADDLKLAIASNFRQNTVLLVVDDAHKLDVKFRDWLKGLKRQGIPMLLLATNPPRSDVFINLPRIELGPLPDYCVRQIMEEAALEREIHLKLHELARLQERVGGNPMLARRVIDEEYLGLDPEAGDHGRYFDTTPLILMLGVFFLASRFLARGLHDPTLYMISGVAGAVFMGVSRLFYSLPKESKRIES